MDYGVVRELVGHGLGKHLHEDPQVPNYGKRGSGAKLKEGMVIAIEPMINLGIKEVCMMMMAGPYEQKMVNLLHIMNILFV